MNRGIWVLVCLLAFSASGGAYPQHAAPCEETAAATNTLQDLGGSLGPGSSSGFHFIENRGQWPTEAGFRALVRGSVVQASPDLIRVALLAGGSVSTAGVALELRMGSNDVVPEGELELAGKSHYFVGKDPTKWVRGAKHFAQLRYRCVAPGIDLVLREEEGQLEYDVIVSAGSDLAGFAIECAGASGLSLDMDGSLILHTTVGDVRQPPPIADAVNALGESRRVAVSFRILDESTFGFVCTQSYEELRIDPGLHWSTYIGSSSTHGGVEKVVDSAVDQAGNITVVGVANDLEFPASSGAFAFPTPFAYGAFVTRFDPNGQMIFSSLVGANNSIADPEAMGLDALGRTVVGGTLLNLIPGTSDFPSTPSAFDPVMSSFTGSAFVFCLSSSGDQLEYSTFLEGIGDAPRIHALSMTESGSAIVGGRTASPSFPTTTSSFSGSYDGFVLRLNPSGSALEWSRFLGGGAVDFVTALAVDAMGQIIVGGSTASSNFPFTSGAFSNAIGPMGSVFVARLSPTGNNVQWCTSIAGTGGSAATGRPSAVSVDMSGAVTLVGETGEQTFPTTAGVLFPNAPPFASNELSISFLARLNNTGSGLIYSTFLGFATHGIDVVTDASGVSVICGATASNTWPTTPGATVTPPSSLPGAFVARVDPRGRRLYYSTVISQGHPAARTLTVNQQHRVTIGGNAGPGLISTPGAVDATFNGGFADAFVASFDLNLQGISHSGTSTPSCLGELVANATELPLAHSPTFGFYCSGAPPQVSGWLILGTESPSPFFLQGAAIHLDRTRRILRVPVVSDVNGFVETSLPLTGAPAGTHFAAQFIFVTPPACSGTGFISASGAVVVDVL